MAPIYANAMLKKVDNATQLKRLLATEQARKGQLLLLFCADVWRYAVCEASLKWMLERQMNPILMNDFDRPQIVLTKAYEIAESIFQINVFPVSN